MSEDTIEVTGSPSITSYDLRLSDLKKIHKQVSEIASEITPDLDEERKPSTIQERRHLMKRVWNKLIPREKEHKKEVTQAISKGEIDSLTQIYNRAGFIRRLVEERSRIVRAKISREKAEASGKNTDSMENPDSVIMLFDANGLKQLNDRDESHAEGNEYLIKIALAISEVARPTDIAARIGGDEFALILPTANYQDAKEFWETRLLPDLIKRGVSISAGCSMIDPDNIDLSIKQADKAMYRAKRVAKIYGTNEYIAHGENMR